MVFITAKRTPNEKLEKVKTKLQIKRSYLPHTGIEPVTICSSSAPSYLLDQLLLERLLRVQAEALTRAGTAYIEENTKRS